MTPILGLEHVSLTDQHEPANGGLRNNGASAWLVFLIAFVSALMAIVTEDELFKTGMSVVAITLFCFFTLTMLNDFRRERAMVKQAENQRSLDEAVQAIVTHEPDAAVLTDLDGEILYMNAAADERFGSMDDAHLSSAFAKLLASPETVLFRLQSRALTLGAAREDLRTRDGLFRLSVVQVGDASLLWRMDQVAVGERERTRAADALTLPMLTVGPSKAILYLNEAFRKLLGARPKSIQDIFGDLTVESGKICTIEGAGGPIEVLIATIPGTAGREEIYVLPAPTEIKRNAGPRAINGDWEAIEDLPVPLLKLATDGTIAASNREARQLFDLETTEGCQVGEVLDGLGRPVQDWVREAAMGRGGHASQFLRGRGPNYEKFIQVTLNISDAEDGRHLIAVLNDVTEFKTLEAQFVQSQKMQAIGQLAGGVAHDFNNLLTAISGHCDLLLERHDQGDHDYGDLIQIHQNANRAASLVKQLLAFSRKQNLQPERVDLRDTLADLTHLLNRLVGEKISLRFVHDEGLSAIKADKRQLEQVVMNLVVNARDAMSEGGNIKVVTSNRKLDADLVRDRATVPAGKYVELRVEDEGHGISPERLPKIFEPFFTTKRTGEGTGLGLSTVYGIVKQTGGFVFAESDGAKGTAFVILLPAHDLPLAPKNPEQTLERDQRPVRGEGVVLLVEDEAPVRSFASRALRLRGYTVLEADCAEAALSLLDDPDLEVDIFVTDVIMPGKDGPTWVREALTERPRTKVVFVSGYAEDAFGPGGNKVENSVFLPKPFSLNQLAATVQQQLH